MASPSPLGVPELIDEYFIENRNRLLEIAAFLDRLDRADPGRSRTDFRIRAFREALTLLASSSPHYVAQIQALLSDPRSEPIPTLDRKSALGAFDRWTDQQ
jgi:hypothetical protein